MLRRIEVLERTDLLGGQSLGASGPYERIVARAYFAVDPKLSANQAVCDLELAPRNEDGLVEFSAEFTVLKPRDPARGNGALLLDVMNRGYKIAQWMFHRGRPSPDPKNAEELGDNFLLARGFTLAWIGWAPDLPRDAKLQRLYAPVATENGRPIRGVIRAEFVADDAKTTSFSLGDNGHIPYPVADPADAQLRLTVRDSGYAKRMAVPRSQWRISDDRTAVRFDAPLEPGRIYELVYPAENPVVAGVGLAAVRDFVSYLRYGGPAAGINALGDQSRFLKRALLFGASQSGRFVRTFLYDGFNADEKGRPVFDASAWAHLAGPARGGFNWRFAQTSRGADPHVNFDYPTFVPPFGTTELLARATRDGVAPKLFLTNTSYEYWAYGASLVHTTPDGKADVELPSNARLYAFAGSEHVPAPLPPRRMGTQYFTNCNDFHWCLRALLLALDRWVASGTQPPGSRYPRLDNGSLIPRNELRFPQIPGVVVPDSPYSVRNPQTGQEYPVFVPAVNRDGNEIAGVLTPEVAVPLGAFTGWNLRAPETGAPTTLAANLGSFFPFPEEEIQRRYGTQEAYQKALADQFMKLSAEGFLLESDLPQYVSQPPAMK